MNVMTTAETFNAPGRHVQTVLGPLWVNEVGKGEGKETVVLWPSIFTDHHMYEALVARSKRRYNFLLIDGPGHGKSPGRADPFTMIDCANAIIDVLDNCGLDRAIVGGTSWGSLAAGELVLIQPQRVAALILMNAPVQIDGWRPELRSRMIALGACWMLHSRLFRNGVAKSFFKQRYLRGNAEYKLHFHAMLAGADPVRLSVALRSVILQGKPLTDRLGAIQAPTLVIAGQDDDMYPLSTQADAAKRWRTAPS